MGLCVWHGSGIPCRYSHAHYQPLYVATECNVKRSTFYQVQANLVKTCIDAATMPGLNGPSTSGVAAITVAFMLGIRFGLSKPNQAGDYMGRWIQQLTDDDNNTLALNHERAIQKVIRPIWEEGS